MERIIDERQFRHIAHFLLTKKNILSGKLSSTSEQITLKMNC